MNKSKRLNSLRTEVLEMVEDHLTPVALKYGYSEVPLETNIKWRPQVLVLGNYSSGKSTLINEFLGAEIQATGQAPTDDSFTVLTFDSSLPSGSSICVTEERDGQFLLNDPDYPFETLKKYGQRFSSHFRLKKVNSPFLENLAIIDTPGMLDSITERDRGYDYQEIIGDLAQIVDLILIIFDPHKAGTIQELHTSLRDTLPARTFEDRIIFVLNRIDECASLVDMIKVYGTLCWNLSQMTGRKDIPKIHLTYSPHAASHNVSKGDLSYLEYLENQREELKASILQAPRHRLDHIATFVETHGQRMSHLLEALISYRRKHLNFKIKTILIGLGISLLTGGAAGFMVFGNPGSGNQATPLIAGGVFAAVVMVFWMMLPEKIILRWFRKGRLKSLDDITPLNTQTRIDSWQAIRKRVYTCLNKSKGKLSLKALNREYKMVTRVLEHGAREIRRSLNELSAVRKKVPPSENKETKGSPSILNLNKVYRVANLEK